MNFSSIFSYILSLVCLSNHVHRKTNHMISNMRVINGNILLVSTVTLYCNTVCLGCYSQDDYDDDGDDDDDDGGATGTNHSRVDVSCP